MADKRRSIADEKLIELEELIGSDEEILQKTNDKASTYQEMHNSILEGIQKKRFNIPR